MFKHQHLTWRKARWINMLVEQKVNVERKGNKIAEGIRQTYGKKHVQRCSTL